MGLRSFVHRVFTGGSRQQSEWLDGVRRHIAASYDAARGGVENAAYWANADPYDADSANSQSVRHTLIRRSRYETYNNGFTDGIAQTYATDLVGVGPSLRMQSQSPAFNQMVEREWNRWAKEIQLRRKLWTMAHAKHVDGESFGIIRRNTRLRHRVKLDLRLYEAEQVSDLYEPFEREGVIDGMEFDEFGNPTVYKLLHEHPGSIHTMQVTLTPERIPARFVLHWFKMRRPGQHRGVPECTSTLNLGASARRFREANLSTAEKVAAWTMFLKTAWQPEQLQPVLPMTSLDILHGMMTALPNSVEPFQLKAEHPSANYSEFIKTLINEQARPKSMPYNKAACDSSSYNYASGRLDHQTYYGHLDVDRADGDDLVMDKLFDEWFDAAIRSYGWLGGEPEAVSVGAKAHTWDWPNHRVADVESEANANDTKLRSGQIGLHRLYSDAGLDFDDEVIEMAQAFGVDESVMRRRLLDVLLPESKQPPAGREAGASGDDVNAALRNWIRRNGVPANRVNGNGAHHVTK